MKFYKKEIQKEVDKIQLKDNTPDFMLVEIYSDFYIDEHGTLRDTEDEVAFFDPKSTNRKDLVVELAKALIQESL